MYWPQRTVVINQKELTGLTAGTLAAQTVNVKLPQSFPIEMIHVRADFTIANVVKTGIKPHGFLNLVKRLRLEVNNGVRPVTKVDVSGALLQQLNLAEGVTLDRATRAAIACYWDTVNGYVASSKYRVNYWIMCAPQNFQEPARTRMLLPVQDYPQPPELQIDIAAAGDISGVADPLSALKLSVTVYGREINSAQMAAIKKGGGFIDWDMLETHFAFDTSLTAQPVVLDVPSPGNYTGLFIEHRSGASPISLADISAVSSTYGGETQWRLEYNQSALRTFRMADQLALNDLSVPGPSPFLAQIAAASALNYVNATQPGPAPAYATALPTPYCSYLDFMTDGVGNDGNEFGSLLNANTQGALKWQLKGEVTTPATAGSEIILAGRRLYDGPAFTSLLSKLSVLS